MELGVSHEQSLSSSTPIVDNIFDKDNKNLVPIRSLSDHDITIKYKYGLSNVEADVLSKISWPDILADNEDLDIDLERMDTHVVNAVLTGSKSKSSLIESVSCSCKIIPTELN